MKRLIFFLLLVGVISCVSCLLLFDGGSSGLDVLKGAFESIKAGTWQWGSFNANAIYVYGLFVFFLINAVLLLSLLVMALTTLFHFNRVYRFYATMWWFLFSAIVFTGVYVYYLFEFARVGNVNVAELFKSVSWIVYTPLGSAIALVIIGMIFKKTENI
jgi:hypothetical protein